MSSASKASERSRPTAATSEMPWCLTSRRAGLQRFLRLAAEARRLQLQAQRVGPAGDAERQVGEQLQGARRVTVVERPFGGEQARALLGRARRGAAPGDRQRLAQLLVAQRPVLQAVGAACGEQVAEHGEFVVLGQLGRVDLDRERALRRLLGPAVAAAEVLRQGFAQRRLAAAVAPGDAPLARPPRQADERGQRLDHGDDQETGADQHQEEQVERDVEPPAAPVEGREAVVRAEGRRGHHGHGEQQHEPDRYAHGRDRARRRPWAHAERPARGRRSSAASVSSGRGTPAPARLLRDLAQQLGGDLRPLRAAIEVALERALRPLQVGLGGVELAASSARRALSRRSFRFSRRKKTCSGATSIASGWSIGSPAPASASPTRCCRRSSGWPGRARAIPGRPGPRARAAARGRRRYAPAPTAGPRAAAVAARLRAPEQRQLVDHAHRFVELDRERRDVGHARCLDPVEVAGDRPAHALEARLVVARQALVALLQRRHQRLGAAGERASAAARRASPPRRRRPGSRRASATPTASVPRAGARCIATSATRASSSATLAAASRARPAPGGRAARLGGLRSALSCWRCTSSRSLLRTRWSARPGQRQRERP